LVELAKSKKCRTVPGTWSQGLPRAPGKIDPDPASRRIESGDVSTQDVLNRFVAALGGTLKLIADFGDEQLKIA
jgi:hypothetical protein